MNEILFNKLLILFLLSNKHNAYSNGYNLIKVLSRYFGIIEFIDIITELEEEKLVESKTVNQVGIYYLTQPGIEELKQNIVFFKQEIEKRYPDNNQMIELLFTNI